MNKSKINPDVDSTLIVGLGLMGQAIAKRFLSNGLMRIFGFDVDVTCCQEFAALGGTLVKSVERNMSEHGVVLLCLPDHRIVTEVMEKMAPSLPAGSLVIDTSTGDPASAVRMGQWLLNQQIDFVDASISGSSAQVATGEVLAMVGGSSIAYHRSLPYLSMFAKNVLHVGQCGCGARMKLITNLVLGLNRAALAEGIAFAHSLGVDLEKTLEVLRNSMAYSRIMDTKGEKMIHGDFTTQAKLSQHLKDVRLMIEASSIDLPLSNAHRKLLEKAESMGWGDLDNSVILRALKEHQS